MKNIFYLLLLLCFSKSYTQNSDDKITVNDTLNNDLFQLENLDVTLIKTINGQSIPDYIASNFNFPDEILGEGIIETIVADFILEKDGSIRYIDIIRKVCDPCAEEVKRVIKKMKMKPIKENGVFVRVKFRIPIRLIQEE